jgi:DNA-binding response OmpR family regulator
VRPVVLLDDRHLQGAAAHAEGLVYVEPAGQRILVVDDDEAMLDVMSQALRAHSYRVDVARTCEDALSLALSEDYRGILLDLILPDASGLSLYRQIARRRPALGRRVIFVTGRLDGGEVKRFVDLVDNRLILKPFDLNALVSTIRQVVSLPGA